VERSVLRGLAAFRWAAWVWMAAVLALARATLERPWIAAGLVAAALVVTVWSTVCLVRDHRRALAPVVVGTEVVVAFALQVADGLVYRQPHVFTTQQSLGVAWPIAAALSAGVAFGPVLGIAAGVALGLGRGISSVLANGDLAPGDVELLLGLDPEQTLSVVTSLVLYAFAGGTAGYAMRLIRAAEGRITSAERGLADARAREDVARRLHDGVLQTLALVERRTDDPALSRLAHDQERELRRYLFATGDDRVVGTGALGDALREAAARFEVAYDARVEVLVPDDLPDLAPEAVDAVAGAAGEAMTNAGKHSGASRVVVSAEPAGAGLTVSVLDDGDGFDPDETPEGVGRSRSIRGRLEEVGGNAEWVSRPGHGCEVRLHLPA
jgi:signal transduction histidine kinase